MKKGETGAIQARTIHPGLKNRTKSKPIPVFKTV